jgi:hypothetical protein
VHGLLDLTLCRLDHQVRHSYCLAKQNVVPNDALLFVSLCFELSELPAPLAIVKFSALETCAQDEANLASESIVVTIVIGRDNYPASSIIDKLLQFRQYITLYTNARVLTFEVELKGKLISVVV